MFPGRRQLETGPLGEAPRADVLEQLVGAAQAGAGVPQPPGSAQPLPVDQVAAGQVAGTAGPAVLVDGFPVMILRAGHVAGGQRPGPGQESEEHRAGTGRGQHGQPGEQIRGRLGVPRALRRLDQVSQHELDLRAVIDPGREAGMGRLVAALAEFEDAAGIVGEHELVALSLAVSLVGDLGQQGVAVLRRPAPRDDQQRPDAPRLPAGFGYRGQLGEAPLRLAQVTAQEAGHPGVAERQGQVDHRPLLPGGRFHPAAQLAQPRVVREDRRVRAGRGKPPERLRGIRGLLPHRVDRAAKQRSSSVQASQLHRPGRRRAQRGRPGLHRGVRAG